MQATATLWRKLAYAAPGIETLAGYRRSNLLPDLRAGVSVAAVAIPVAVAYAQLSGFNPVVGLYSSILPLVAYALFGTSRQLIVGPDAATCALVAAAITPLAGGDPEAYLSLSMTLAFLTGLFCIGASFFRLGALADFLSKPILVGFLNGVAISITLGQLGKLFGYSLDTQGIIHRLIEFVFKLPQTHWPTLAVSAGTFILLALSPRVLPKLPPALVALVATTLVVWVFGLDAHGVAVVGSVPAGLPGLHIPEFSPSVVPALIADAAGVALVSFSSAMLTARSFASKNRYDIDVDREFSALGAANIAAAVSQGFAISGADSRTAMNDAAGGKTQVASLFTAASIGLVLLFLTTPMKYVPIAALSVVLVQASLSLFDAATLRFLYRLEKRELLLAVATMVGVVTVGVINAILLAVALALLRFIHTIARPQDAELGRVEGLPGFHSTLRHPEAQTDEGLLLYRFDAPLTFFNAPYFKQRVLHFINERGDKLRWFVIDAIPITQMDSTGFFTMGEVAEELARRGVKLAFAGRKTQISLWSQEAGFASAELDSRLFPTLRQAVKAFNEESAASNGAAVSSAQDRRSGSEAG